MKQWEYKVVNIMPKLTISDKKFQNDFVPQIESACEELGNDGWELVSNTSYDAGLKFVLIFKREK